VGTQASDWESGRRLGLLADGDGIPQSTDAGGERPMNDARTMSRSSGSALGAALKRIAASNREPTPWEAGCLYAALCALSVGDHRIAEQKIALSTLGDIDQPPPVRVFPPLTVDDLRDAFAALINATRAQATGE